MIRVPHDLQALLFSLVRTFRRPATARRVFLYFAAAIFTVGDRTVSNVLRLLSLIKNVNPSTYHCLFSRRRWNGRPLMYLITKYLLDRFVPIGVVKVCGDETVDGHRGKKVLAKSRHRDAVRSSHSQTVFRTAISGMSWLCS